MAYKDFKMWYANLYKDEKMPNVNIFRSELSSRLRCNPTANTYWSGIQLKESVVDLRIPNQWKIY